MDSESWKFWYRFVTFRQSQIWVFLSKPLYRVQSFKLIFHSGQNKSLQNYMIHMDPKTLYLRLVSIFLCWLLARKQISVFPKMHSFKEWFTHWKWDVLTRVHLLGGSIACRYRWMMQKQLNGQNLLKDEACAKGELTSLFGGAPKFYHKKWRFSSGHFPTFQLIHKQVWNTATKLH